jgi:hypothetical protein
LSGKRDITLIAGLLILLAVIVISGMIASAANRQTDTGEVQTSVFVAQEIIGGITLAALGLTALGLPGYARGQRAVWTYALVAIDALLGVVWILAWASQFAS